LLAVATRPFGRDTERSSRNLCLCTEDDADYVGEVADLNTEIAEHQRVIRLIEMRMRNPSSDPDERARQKRIFVLTQRSYRLRVMKAAEAEGTGKERSLPQ